MVHFLSSAASSALVRLVCPHCGVVQARARATDDTRYACKGCRVTFTVAEGRARAEASAAHTEAARRRR